jgi:hypothetical protein
MGNLIGKVAAGFVGGASSPAHKEENRSTIATNKKDAPPAGW